MPDFSLGSSSTPWSRSAQKLTKSTMRAQCQEFGALVLAATMNIRQVLSILNSYIMRPDPEVLWDGLRWSHPISSLQILALLLVFASLFYKSRAPQSSICLGATNLVPLNLLQAFLTCNPGHWKRILKRGLISKAREKQKEPPGSMSRQGYLSYLKGKEPKPESGLRDVQLPFPLCDSSPHFERALQLC